MEWECDTLQMRQRQTERGPPHHVYNSLKPIQLWNRIQGRVDREREAALEIRMRLLPPLSRSSSSDICPLNSISPTEQSNKQWESQREREKHGRKEKRKKGINDSKEERSDRTGPDVPARHCFTSHCTDEENLSYVAAFHIAFTIYVPARIMQLDGSVERHQ